MGEHLYGVFVQVAAKDGEPADLLVLQLHTGDRIGLVAPRSFTEPGVIVRTDGHPQTAIAAFRELTGLDIDTARSADLTRTLRGAYDPVRNGQIVISRDTVTEQTRRCDG